MKEMSSGSVEPLGVPLSLKLILIAMMANRGVRVTQYQSFSELHRAQLKHKQLAVKVKIANLKL
jgi:hypothetical protein